MSSVATNCSLFLKHNSKMCCSSSVLHTHVGKAGGGGDMMGYNQVPPSSSPKPNVYLNMNTC